MTVMRPIRQSKVCLMGRFLAKLIEYAEYIIIIYGKMVNPKSIPVVTDKITV